MMPAAPILAGPSSPDSSLLQFENALARARFQTFLARLMGRRPHLARLAEASEGVVALPQPEQLEDIPIDAIVGSVDRAHDYTASFLPRHESDAHRWAGVYRLMGGHLGGLPPIVVRRFGDRYYVVDGHHRVSVARWLGHQRIEAHVTELRPLRAAATVGSRARHGGVTVPCLA